MSITADCHLHSSHSGDSDTPMENMVLEGISRGLTTMCFTEHMDMDYPDSPDEPGSIFFLNADSYLYELACLKEKYQDKIRLLFGLELGLQPEIIRKNAVYAKSYEFDFIIGSTHICKGKDPYYPAFFEERDEATAFREYFEEELTNIRKFSNFDVCGHLDYVVRYGSSQDKNYSYETYKDVIDEILKVLIDKEKGLELNTGGIKKGMKDFHPCMDILKRYKELGGEIITVGADAHTPDKIAYDFDKAAAILAESGFKYYTVFQNRKPEFVKL